MWRYGGFFYLFGVVIYLGRFAVVSRGFWVLIGDLFFGREFFGGVCVVVWIIVRYVWCKRVGCIEYIVGEGVG